MQILPAVDLRGGNCVRLRQGDYSRETVFSANPVEMARQWAEEGVEWLHLVDLDGAKQGRPVNHGIVKNIAQSEDIKCELGGGIRDEEAIRLMLDESHVGRIIIGTKALKDPDWFRNMATAFPGKLVLGIDARDSMVATEGWLDVSAISAISLAEQYADLDLAALIYTNIANDGMMQGVDEATIRDMRQLADFGFQVIASGGVTTIDDVKKLREASEHSPNLSGMIIGRALYEGTLTVADAVREAR